MTGQGWFSTMTEATRIGQGCWFSTMSQVTMIGHTMINAIVRCLVGANHWDLMAIG